MDAAPDASVPPDPVPLSVCPVPPGGDGRQLMVLHDHDGTRSLTRRDRDGTDHLVATLPSAPDPTGLRGGFVVVAPGGAKVYVASGDDARFLVDVASGSVEALTLPEPGSTNLPPRIDPSAPHLSPRRPGAPLRVHSGDEDR